MYVCVCDQWGNTGHQRGQESLASIEFKPLPGEVREEVRDMGAEHQKQARTRFDHITEAYKAIKKAGLLGPAFLLDVVWVSCGRRGGAIGRCRR